MEQVILNICQLCGSEKIKKIDNNSYKCMSCDATYVVQNDNDTENLARIALIENALQELRMSPPHFDEAEEKFEDIVKKYPTCSAGYWGLVRSKYGIKYEDDLYNKSVPSCYKSSYADFCKDKNYLKAIELAETEQLREKYISEANYIATLSKEWTEKARQFDYDVFLCFKATENVDGRIINTHDQQKMQDLYTLLTRDGYNVFYSPVSLRSHGIAGQNSEPYIYNALDKTKCLIVYGSNPEYFSSTWVKNEWSRYLLAMRNHKKPQDSLLVLYEGFDAKELPLQLRKIQAIEFSKLTAYSDITDSLKRINFDKNYTPVIQKKSVDIKKDLEFNNKKELQVIARIELGAKQGTPINKQIQRIGLSPKAQLGQYAHGNYSVSQQDLIDSALNCLVNGMYNEGQIFIDECLEKMREMAMPGW